MKPIVKKIVLIIKIVVRVGRTVYQTIKKAKDEDKGEKPKPEI